MSAYLEQQLQI